MRDDAKLDLARRLRKDMTDAERRLWSRLRQRQLANYRFRRQHPIGPYIVDFACLERHLIVEVDGGQHADSSTDLRTDAFLRGKGYRVLRFWNNDVLGRTESVLVSILGTLAPTRPHPSPPPQAGEGV